MTIDQILQSGLDEALRQYVTRNFHVLISEGCNPDSLSRCLMGVRRALGAYSEAMVAIEELLADEAERAS